MDLGLEGKAAVVTGASRGIGREIAAAFAREGARVAALARTESDLAETVEMLEDGGAGAHLAVVCDVTDPDGVDAAVGRVLAEFGRIDVLVNNAGGRQNFARLDQLDAGEWQRALDSNLSSVFYVSKAVAQGMIAGGSGAIVNIASIAGPVGFTRIGAYTAAKAGVIALTKVMAAEWAEFGVRANAVAPGWTESPMNYELRTDPANRPLFESIRDQTLLKRFGSPSETAAAVLFLAGSTGSYITGETLAVDGGWLAV